MSRLRGVCIAFVLLVLIGATVQADEARLLRYPNASSTHIAFIYADDIWVAPRAGGEARRLTTHNGTERAPMFSPDGSMIAFTGEYDGNTDVYVVPVEGGEPVRLTYHPAGDSARGWTNDGKSVLFISGRESAPRPHSRLWTISVDGGMPTALPMQMAYRGSYSPDGKRMAYMRNNEVNAAWRKYRGGTTTEIWLIDLASYEIEKIPRNNSNDTHPMWIGDKVYFVSDRDGYANLYSYDTASKEVAQLTNHRDFDIRSASAGGGVVAYEQDGYVHIYDPATGQAKKVAIEINGDLPWTRPHFETVGNMIASGDISPTGVRAVFQARGEIFTVPAKKGDYRNITNSPGVHDRYPTWSPDGAKIAWFSDEGGEYKLMIGDQKGLEAPRAITFENPSFYYEPKWSPDSKKILFYDKHLRVCFVDVESGEMTVVDTDNFGHPERTLSPSWAPDSKWITYSKRLDNQQHAIFIYSLADGSIHQITDGLSDAVSPAFDKSGKYLYFLAGTNYGLNTGWLDMTSYERPVTREAYLVVLSSEESSPFLPESDEEKVKEEPKAEEKKAEGEEKEEFAVKIDFEGIDQRILAVEMPERAYSSLATGAENTFFYLEGIPNQPGFILHRYDVSKREAADVMSGIFGYTVSADGKKLLYFGPGTFGIIDAGGKGNVGDGRLATGALQMRVDPRAEWKQIYLEGWRINRDYFYDEKMHGADWDAVYKKYEPFLKYIGHRSDLNNILAMMIGELVCGHAYVGGGDYPDVGRVPGGLLGADYAVENGRYKFARIYTGENWNPDLRAPLTAPGLNISEGDYLLEVNGVELKAPMNLYSLFEGTAGQQVMIRVNSEPTLEGAKLVTVVPVPNEYSLRQRAWIEDNRRKVDELSGGKLAYVYLPNTAGDGYTNFNRYYFLQMDKQGAVIDERFNGGGSAADYIVDLLDRKLLNHFATRDGKVFNTPAAALYGPKVMIIDENAGSGGDALPYYFRKRGIGPLIGKRTWGGLVGIYDYPQLIDGGFITAPRVAFYSTDGEWAVENEGVPPDIEVEQTPKLVIAGHDPQLEAAVKECLRLLEENPVRLAPRPEPIDRVSDK